jgi:hypothetical protein
MGAWLRWRFGESRREMVDYLREDRSQEVCRRLRQ